MPERRFLFKLCLAFGIPHPRYLMQHLTSRDVAEWMAYNQLEPFGEWAAFWRSGLIASILANIYRSRNAKEATPKDFMPPDPMEGLPDPPGVIFDTFKLIAEQFKMKDAKHGAKHR